MRAKCMLLQFCLGALIAHSAPAQVPLESGDAGYVTVKRIRTPDRKSAFYSYEILGQEESPREPWPEKPARVCIRKAAAPKRAPSCFVGRSSKRDHQRITELSLIPLSSKGKSKDALLFVAKFNAGGSGSLGLVSLFVQCGDVSKHESRLCSIVPEILVSEFGEHQIDQTTGNLGTAITIADFIWGEGEAHFDPHFFKVKILNLSSVSDSFEPLSEYATIQKYSCSNFRVLCVLKSERVCVAAILRSKRPG